jgi:hypothetical protein
MNQLKKIAYRAIASVLRVFKQRLKVRLLNDYFGKVLFDDCMRWDMVAVVAPTKKGLGSVVVQPVLYTLHDRQ